MTRTLANPQLAGAPLTLLVKRQDGPWLQVFLPVRPNGSTGWVRGSDVKTARVPCRVEISTAAHLTVLLAPTNPGYGPFAYGLSAFSTVLMSFGGGPGQIGLHGTSEAKSIGHSSSHGCIRLANSDIATRARALPLGTPVNIT